MSKEQRMALRVAKKQEIVTVWLLGTLKSKDISHIKVANWLNITRQAFEYKAKHNTFTLEDILIIFHMLDAEPDEVAHMMTWED